MTTIRKPNRVRRRRVTERGTKTVYPRPVKLSRLRKRWGRWELPSHESH